MQWSVKIPLSANIFNPGVGPSLINRSTSPVNRVGIVDGIFVFPTNNSSMVCLLAIYFYMATCKKSQVLLAGVSVGFPGVLPFRPTYRLARLYE